jgi:hypothetical protein
LYLPVEGLYCTVSKRLLISSTPVFDAASISKKSKCLPAFISTQELQVSHGAVTGVFADRQFRHFDKILARVVFPTPLVPENIYAW